MSSPYSPPYILYAVEAGQLLAIETYTDLSEALSARQEFRQHCENDRAVSRIYVMNTQGDSWGYKDGSYTERRFKFG